jgi:hypothetical protein
MLICKRGEGFSPICLALNSASLRALALVCVLVFNQGEGLLNDAVKHASRLGLVRPLDHVVVVQRVHDDFCVKVLLVGVTPP